MDLPKAVILSSVGAQHASGTGVIAALHEIVNALADAASSIVFLRPAYFVGTWEEVAASAIEEGVLPTFPHSGQRIPMVSTRGVRRAAATLLSKSWTGTRVVELSGPEDWSAGEVANAFARILRRPVEPVFVPGDQRPAELGGAGPSAKVVTALPGRYESITNGRGERQEGLEHRRGTASLTDALKRIVTNHRVQV